MKISLIKTKPSISTIASAKTCYNGVVYPNAVQYNSKTNDFLQSLLNSGHHTTFQHSAHYFTFVIEGVSRYALHSFFHNFEHYNSSQVSQRYVPMTPEYSYVPEGLTEKQRRIWDAALADSFVAYSELSRLCHDKTKQLYSKVFPNKEAKVVDVASSKLAIENARYIVPQAITASLHYTINLTTLLRMRAVANTYDCKNEIIPILEAMSEQVLAYDDRLQPLFDKVPIGGFFDDYEYNNLGAKLIKQNFDSQFSDVYGNDFEFSKLISHNALPAELNLFEEIFNVNHKYEEISKLSLNVDDMMLDSRIGGLLNFTFANRNSLSCDSQYQRHRAIHVVKRFMPDQIVNDDIDYVTPTVIDSRKTLSKRYHSFMENQLANYNYALEAGIAPELAAYLLPNAVKTRSFVNVDFNGLKHFANLRLCFNAQKEVWDVAAEQCKQVSKVVPELAHLLAPKCSLRNEDNIKPVCTEGARFCGTQVWNIDKLYDYKREY